MRIRSISLAALTLLSVSANADERCLDEASNRYNLPPRLLRAIAMVESNADPYAIGKNKASVDIGLMQINSSWLPKIQQHGYSLKDLFDPCTNAHWGAWVLANNVQRYGLTWQAVGAYNARTPKKQAEYAWRVFKAMGNMP